LNIKFNPSLDDAFIWASNKNGAYTTKSGYAWLLSYPNTIAHGQTSSSWSWIWKLKSFEKHKFLFWLACQNSVPTILLLNNRNMASSVLCTHCGLEDETFLYCVCDCNFSRIIWNHVGFNGANFFADMEVSHWLKEGSSGPRAFLFTATIWWAWRHRNLMCLNNENLTLSRLSYNIHNMVDSFSHCFSINSHIFQVERFIRWNNDNYSCTIFNVDGSSLAPP